MRYTLEYTYDGGRYHLAAAFESGDPSRFGAPFDDEIVVKEAYAYEETWPFRFVRVTRSDGQVLFDHSEGARHNKHWSAHKIG